MNEAQNKANLETKHCTIYKVGHRICLKDQITFLKLFRDRNPQAASREQSQMLKSACRPTREKHAMIYWFTTVKKARPCLLNFLSCWF